MHGDKFHVTRCGTETQVLTLHLAGWFWVGDLTQKKMQQIKRVILPPSLVENDKLALI